MSTFSNGIRRNHKHGLSALLVIATLALATTPAFSSSPNPETIQAAVIVNGRTVNITLVIDSFSSPADLEILSQAFQDGQDRALATALSKITPVGSCSVAGAPAYNVAYIQMAATPTGRQITFIASRPLQAGEDNSNAPDESFDLAVGQFDLNDGDITKSTGFLYPASKLTLGEQGDLHYDLAGAPWLLVNVLDSKIPPSEVLALAPAK